MKKIALLTIMALVVFGTADSYGQRLRPKYRNFSFSSQKLTIDGVGSDVKGIGGAFTTGRSYIVHPKPIAGMLRLGIDATWLDVNYAGYDYSRHDDVRFDKRHQLEVAVGVGVSAHVTPYRLLGVHAYFRFMPSFSGMLDSGGGFEGTAIMGNYASFFVAGGAVSWGTISLGAEARWGGAIYSRLGGDGEDLVSKPKAMTNGMRAYVSLRF